MVMPTGPKDIKQKSETPSIGQKENKGQSMDMTKMIIINTVIIAVVCSLFMGINYHIQNSLLSQKLSKLAVASGEEEDLSSGDEDVVERGIVVDLGDFILNLSDTNARRYLKVNVAIELSRKDTDPDPAAAASGGGHGGHGSAPDPMAQIEQEMSQYKPAIRDAVISCISTKNSDELATIAGKEQAKQEIKESVNAILNGEREVIRVSFGNFIIQ